MAIQALGWTPYLAGAVLALCCGVLSVRVVLHRQVFLAASFSQTAAAGVAMGFFLHHDHPALDALVLTVVVILALGRALAERASPGEVPLGVLYAAGAAASMLFVARSAVGREEVSHLLEGDVLFTTEEAVWRLTALAIVTLVALAAGGRHLTLIGFDPEGAAALGYHPERWRLAMLFGLAVTVALGMESGGILLTFGALVVPGAAALRVARNIGWASTLAAVLAVTGHSIGYLVSFHPSWDLPPAATTVGLWVLAYLVARLFDPGD
jgi:ABC-type Mn2+/Zn2+ transport system permease subunit